MKKHLQRLLLIVTLLVPWSLQGQCTDGGAISDLPYFNDFENEPHYQTGSTSRLDAFPNCWTRINDGSSEY